MEQRQEQRIACLDALGEDPCERSAVGRQQKHWQYAAFASGSALNQTSLAAAADSIPHRKPGHGAQAGC